MFYWWHSWSFTLNWFEVATTKTFRRGWVVIILWLLSWKFTLDQLEVAAAKDFLESEWWLFVYCSWSFTLNWLEMTTAKTFWSKMSVHFVPAFECLLWTGSNWPLKRLSGEWNVLLVCILSVPNLNWNVFDPLRSDYDVISLFTVPKSEFSWLWSNIFRNSAVVPLVHRHGGRFV